MPLCIKTLKTVKENGACRCQLGLSTCYILPLFVIKLLWSIPRGLSFSRIDGSFLPTVRPYSFRFGQMFKNMLMAHASLQCQSVFTIFTDLLKIILSKFVSIPILSHFPLPFVVISFVGHNQTEINHVSLVQSAGSSPLRPSHRSWHAESQPHKRLPRSWEKPRLPSNWVAKSQEIKLEIWGLWSSRRQESTRARLGGKPSLLAESSEWTL